MLKTIAIEASFFWIIIFLLIEDKEILAQKLLTVQLFLKLSIKTKLSSLSADSCQNLPSNFYFKLCAMFGAVVVRSLFFPSPFVSSSRFFAPFETKRGRTPPSPFFHARSICTTYFVHAISRDSCRRHGTRTAKPFDYRPATAYRRLSVWNTGHPRISPSPPIMLISR